MDIESAVRTNSRSLGDFLCALWPWANPRNDRVKPILERIGNSGVMVGEVVEDTIEVSKRLGSIRHSHAGRCF